MSINRMNSIISWASIFTLAWGLILKQIPSNVTTWGFFIFFLIVALISGVYIREENYQRTNMSKVKIVKKDNLNNE